MHHVGGLESKVRRSLVLEGWESERKKRGGH